MAAVTHQPRSFLGKAASQARQSRLGPQLRRLGTLAVAAIREHATTFAAWAAIDLGVAEAYLPAGLVVAGISVLVLDLHVRG